MSGRPPADLSAAERAFCGHYVANGKNAKEAAIRAGYSENGAKQAGSRILKRTAVQDEIARLIKVNTKAVDRLLTKAVENGSVPEGMIKRDGGMAIALSRAYAQYGLTQALGMALGQVPQVRSRVIKPRPTKAEPRPPVIVDEYFEKVADAKGAAYCATLLNKEIDRIEGKPPEPTTIEGELAEETPGAKVARVFREKMGLAPMPDDYDPSKEPGYR